MQVNNCHCSQCLQASSVCVNKIWLCTGVQGDHPNRTCKYLLVSPLSSHTHTHTQTHPHKHIHTPSHTKTHMHGHGGCAYTQTHTQTQTHTHTHTHTNPHSSELCMMFIISCRHIPFSKLSQLSKHMLLVYSGGGEDSTVCSGMW